MGKETLFLKYLHSEIPAGSKLTELDHDNKTIVAWLGGQHDVISTSGNQYQPLRTASAFGLGRYWIPLRDITS